ncbi:hypothetical protein ACN47E_001316 [Coniothyrium glycines]
MVPDLRYLARCSPSTLTTVVGNSASTLLHLINSSIRTKVVSSSASLYDPLSQYRTTLETVFSDLTSSEPPNRTWALHVLHTLIKTPASYVIIDVPSITYRLIATSLTDPESYVHTAVVPVLVELARRAPFPVVTILGDAFVDVDEQSLKLGNGKVADNSELQLLQAVDFRLRVGEVLNSIVCDQTVWGHTTEMKTRYRVSKRVFEACLFVAGRRGQRAETLAVRTELAGEQLRLHQEGEAAWGGPIPSVFPTSDPDAENGAKYDAMLRLIQGWEQTGVEEDLRVRASALSILSTILEHHLALMRQPMLDASLQIVVSILTMETSIRSSIVRRACVMVVMGLLKALNGALEDGKDLLVNMSIKQQDEIRRTMSWIMSEDEDDLVKDHAANVIEGLETLEMGKLYNIRNGMWRTGPNLGLHENLRGLLVTPTTVGKENRTMVEEIE